MKSETIDVLRLLEKELKPKYGTSIYVVGRYVRDILRKKKKSKKINIVVQKLTVPDLKRFLRKYGEVSIETINKVKGVLPKRVLHFKVPGDEIIAEIELCCGQGKGSAYDGSATLKQDSNLRCFSIDALYLPINSMVKSRTIDYVGGRNDIAAKSILSIGDANKKFKKDPSDILRAFSLAAATGYTISNHVSHAIRDNAKLLSKVPNSVIKEELVKVLLSTKPSTQLKLMLKLGVLNVILPDLARCAGCLQDKRFHKYDVFNHLIYTCDNTEKDLVLRLAGLLHDIGKPESRGVKEDGRITFYKHDVIGVKIAKAILVKLGFEPEITEKVCRLVKMHMYHYTKEWTDAGINRFINSAGIEEKDIENLDQFPLFKLRKAERLGNGLKKNGVTKEQEEFQRRITKIFKGNSIRRLKIDGSDIIKTFNITPGPEIGKILRYLVKIIEKDEDLNTKEILLHFVLDYTLNNN